MEVQQCFKSVNANMEMIKLFKHNQNKEINFLPNEHVDQIELDQLKILDKTIKLGGELAVNVMTVSVSNLVSSSTFSGSSAVQV